MAERRVYGTGIEQQVDTSLVDRIPPYDPRSGDHYWIIPMAYRVNPATFRPDESVHLDVENLVAVGGAGCYYCEQEYTKLLATRRCKGEPR